MNPYQEKGFNSRREYLESLADEYGRDRGLVIVLASLLGQNEDFDGLLTALEDDAEDDF